MTTTTTTTPYNGRDSENYNYCKLMLAVGCRRVNVRTKDYRLYFQFAKRRNERKYNNNNIVLNNIRHDCSEKFFFFLLVVNKCLLARLLAKCGTKRRWRQKARIVGGDDELEET